MSLIGTAAAVVTGFFTAWNPQAMMAAYSIGAGVEAYVNAPDQIGPRLEDLKVQLSSYGAAIPFEWGTNRHTGTIMWPRELNAVEHEHEESAKGGPEVVTFTYTLSCAVLICEGPIEGIRRIWANKKLVYDASVENTGPTQDPVIGSLRIHLGTETQEVDPLIEATDGPSPAYLGFAYVVFEDYDVTDLGGRPPQWEFEVITAGVTDLPDSSTWGEAYGLGGTSQTFQADLDPDTGHLLLSTMAGHAVFDAGTGAYIIDPTATAVPQIQEYDGTTGTLLWATDIVPNIEAGGSSVYPIAGSSIVSDGWYFVGRGSPGWPSGGGAYAHGIAVNMATREVFELVDACSHGQFQNAFYWSGTPVPVLDNNKVFMAGSNGLSGGAAVGFMPARVYALGGLSSYDPVPDRTGAEPLWSAPQGWMQARLPGTSCAPGFDGVAVTFPDWAFRSTRISTGAVIVQGWGPYLTWVSHAPAVSAFDLTPPNYFESVTLPGGTGMVSPIAYDPDNEVLWLFAGDNVDTLYSVRALPGGLELEEADYVAPATVRGVALDEQSGQLRVLYGGGFGALSTLVLVNPLTGTESEELTVSTPLANASGRMWDMPNQKKVVFASGFVLLDIPYGVTLAPQQVQLSTIVSAICVRAGLTTSDIDVSQLTDMVDGYIVPRQMTARAAIETLQQAFPFDVVESGDLLKFVMRGGSIAATIPESDRAARENGQDAPDALTIVRAFEFELPVECDVEYPDIDADHLTGNQYDRRITKDTKQKINIQTAVVMTAAKAKQVARMALYQAWLNHTYRWTTTRKYAHLEPTDVVLLPTQSAQYVARITAKREQPNGVIEWEAKLEDAAIYSQPGTGAAAVSYSPQTIFSPADTVLEMLDIPILRDQDASHGFYVAMAGTTASWRGAQLFRSADGGTSYAAVFAQTNAATIGTALSVLGDFDGGNIFDDGNSVIVRLYGGATLTSNTQAQVLNGAGVFALGAAGRWEIVQYTTATLVDSNTYLLTGLLRGRRGTEWAISTHAAADHFVFANTANWRLFNPGSEDIGVERHYKAPTFGQRITAVDAQEFTDALARLRPYAPAQLQASADGSGGYDITWTHRSILDGGWRDNVDVALDAAFEKYIVTIRTEDGDTVVSYDATSESMAYSAAQIAIDFGTPPARFGIHVAQRNTNYGTGVGVAILTDDFTPVYDAPL